MKAYVYCKTTTRYRTALQAQIAECRNYCDQRGLSVEEIFTDAGIDSRVIGPGLKRLVHSCLMPDNEVRHIVVPSAVGHGAITEVLEQFESAEGPMKVEE